MEVKTSVKPTQTIFLHSYAQTHTIRQGLMIQPKLISSDLSLCHPADPMADLYPQSYY